MYDTVVFLFEFVSYYPYYTLCLTGYLILVHQLQLLALVETLLEILSHSSNIKTRPQTERRMGLPAGMASRPHLIRT